MGGLHTPTTRRHLLATMTSLQPLLGGKRQSMLQLVAVRCRQKLTTPSTPSCAAAVVGGGAQALHAALPGTTAMTTAPVVVGAVGLVGQVTMTCGRVPLERTLALDYLPLLHA